jgi:hypothetical protein
MTDGMRVKAQKKLSRGYPETARVKFSILPDPALKLWALWQNRHKRSPIRSAGQY